MQVTAVHAEVFHPNDDLAAYLKTTLNGRLREGDVVALTSKIVSLAEGRLVPKEEISKRALIEREADMILGEGRFGALVTLKHGLMIPTAGIDESNSEMGAYILYPSDPYASAERVWLALRQAFALERLAVIITDSHSRPFRMGVTGVALSHWGMRAVRSLVGEPDIFGRPLKFTHVDVVDSLASAAVLMMGEAADRCPVAIISGAPVDFAAIGRRSEVAMPPDEDMYFPIFKRAKSDEC